MFLPSSIPDNVHVNLLWNVFCSSHVHMCIEASVCRFWRINDGIFFHKTTTFQVDWLSNRNTADLLYDKHLMIVDEDFWRLNCFAKCRMAIGSSFSFWNIPNDTPHKNWDNFSWMKSTHRLCVSAVSVYILPDTFWCIHAFCVIIFRCFFFCLGIWLLLRCTMTNVLAFTHIANRMRPCM